MSSTEIDTAGADQQTEAERKVENVNKPVTDDQNEGSENKRGKLNPERCHLYLERKRRYCRSVPPVGSKYCVDHAQNAEGKRKRVACPLDSKHFCYEDQLKQHLKKCNARDDCNPVYFVRNINAGEVSSAVPSDSKVSLNNVPTEEILQMVDTVKRLYQEHVKPPATDILSHSVLDEELAKPTNGPAAQKHLQQQASLVAHLEKLDLLKNHLCYMEFGAGKGATSHWVQRALGENASDTQFILVEKGGVRYKMDCYHRGDQQGPTFERLRIDIQHLDLDKVESIKGTSRPIVGIGKHLCGGATDLMLRCLIRPRTSVSDDGESTKSDVAGIVLALCCHHRCDWQSYVGKAFIERCGLAPRDFHLLTCMTSWATCATRTFINKLKEREKEESNDANPEEKAEEETNENEEYNHPRYGSLTPEDREEIGYMCKRLIDEGRLQYLRDHSFQSYLVTYIDKTHSLENVAILAKISGSTTSSVETTGTSSVGKS